MTAMDRIAGLFGATLFVFTLNAAPGAHAQEAPAEIGHEWGQPTLGTTDNPWTYLMQDWLGDNGFRPGAVDGWYGKNTRAAVVRFQQAVGLEPSGAWTWETSQAQLAYVPPPPPTPVLGGACSQWSDEALAAGFTADQWPTVNRVMWGESRCNPGARNRSGATGLMQIMPMWADDCGGSPGDLYDPMFNLRCARVVLREQGWTAWSVY